MGLNDLLKKISILALLFLVVVSVYLLKNDQVREYCYSNLESVISRFAFANREQIALDEIEIEDINIDKLIIHEKDEEAVAEEGEKKPEDKLSEISRPSYKPERAIEESNPASLQEIEEQIEQITLMAQELKSEVETLIALNEINQQIGNIAEKLAEMQEGLQRVASAGNLVCVACSLTSSI